MKCGPVVLAACLSVPQPSPLPTAAAATGPRTLRVLVTGVNDRGEAGVPLPGAHVCAAPTRGEDVCTDADRDGVVSLAVRPAVYSLRVDGPDKARWITDQRTVETTKGDAALWVGLFARVRISGTVRDEDGKPVARADACAVPATPDLQTCARSGTDGRYVVEARAGVYRIHVDGPPGGKLVSTWARERPTLESADVFDARAANVGDVDVSLAHGVVLRGTVRLAGATIEDAQVCTRTLAAPRPWDCERTDKRGSYAVLREPGTYWLWVLPPDRMRAVAVWYDRVLTGVEATPYQLDGDKTLDVSLVNGPQIRGKVRTSTGEPVADAFVCADTPFASGRICRPTGADGSYAITTRSTEYILNVVPPPGSDLVAEYWSHKRDWTEADRIRLGVTDFQVDLVLFHGSVVKGTVKDRRGVPIAGATLDLSDARGVVVATDTDATGAFQMAVPPGRYELSAFPTFFTNLLQRDTEIDARGSLELDVVLDDGPTAEVR